jgi:hypothetical protein
MFSFGSASMLWWGLAAAIPFALHLWNRKPRQILPFAATRFLVAATKRQSRRIKFQQWLLLLTRVAILLLFALALAEPRWRTGAGTVESGVPTHHVLIMDDSYSMQAKSDAGTRLDAAKMQLAQLVNDAPLGDLFSVITMGDPPEVVIAGPSHDRDEIEGAIEQLQPRPVGAKVVPAVSLANRLIEDSKALDQSRNYRVTFASDLARNSWKALTPGQLDAELNKFANAVSWTMVEMVDSPLQNNLAISQFRADQEKAYLGHPIAGTIELINTGTQDREGAFLEIRSGDRVLFREAISLKAGQQVSKSWSIGPATEPLALEARVDSDDLPMDNSRFLAIDVRAAPRVLCLASSREATEHFVLALTAGPAETRPKVDRTEVDAWETLGSTTLSPEYDVVVLLNLEPPSGAAARNLMRFVESGGGVLIGLGDRSIRANATTASAANFYPATLGGVVRVDSPRFDPLNNQHPLLAAFRDAPEVGLLSLPIWRYCKLEAVSPDAKIAAKFGNGDPALVEWALGRGRVVLFAGSLGAESVDRQQGQAMPWSGATGAAAYVPLIQECVKRVAAPQPRPPLLVGDAPPRSKSEQRAEVEYQLGDRWTRQANVTQALNLPGFYRFAAQPSEPPFAVNLDSRESWYESDRERWTAWMTENLAVSPPVIIDRTSYRSLSTWLLVPLALLICGEIVLATLLRRTAAQFAPPGRIAS